MQILNNVAVTSKRTLVVLQVLRIKLCRTILKVGISTALARNNSCTNIELKYLGSFFQKLCFEAIFLLTFLLLHARNVQLNFCVFEELCFALFSDSGFRIPHSGFRIPDCGFRFLVSGFPVYCEGLCLDFKIGSLNNNKSQ